VRFITDENIPRAVVEMLRDLGHDVMDMAESGLKGTEGDCVISTGSDEGRIIISHDKEFGDILKYPLKEHSAVTLLRLRAPTPRNTSQAIGRVLAADPRTKNARPGSPGGRLADRDEWKARIECSHGGPVPVPG